MSTLPSSPEKTTKRPWALLLSIGAVVLLAALLLWFQYQQEKSTRELSKTLASIQALGFPVTAIELEAWYVEPPVGQNAALVYDQAFNQMTPLPESSPWFYTQSQSNIFNPTNPVPPAARVELASLIVSNQSALQLLHNGGNLPASRYPINLSAGQNTLLPHLSKLKAGTRLLSAEALDHALSNRPEAALDSLVASLRLGHSLSNEPVIISHLVQIASYALTVRALENILNRTTIPPALLSTLDTELARTENSLNLTRALVGERSMNIGIFENPATMGNGGSMTTAESFSVSAYRLSGLYYSDFKTYLEFMDLFLAGSQKPPSERLVAFHQVEQELEKRMSQGRWKMLFTSLLIPALTRTGEKGVRVTADLRLARLALMILTYKSAHDGKLPASLADLAGVSLDPFDDQPLRYRQTETGFLIWSIGPDGIDQNGQPRPRNSSDDAYDLLFTIEFPAVTPTK
jgi:hypothetical protein